MTAVANDHKLHDLKQQKFICSQLLRMGVQEQGVIGARLSPKALGENSALPLLVSFFFFLASLGLHCGAWASLAATRRLSCPKACGILSFLTRY